ncbi:ABC transporter ATP-binding protein [Bacillus piscicola]|uniref:ABC transporter ATP-binding protein n=1 Tax=Bacillus piscicola TaxID=1632684 RepID=UPI001F08B896|nr:ABC transporter ATP-binding protein [Bacillus piscicola]
MKVQRISKHINKKQVLRDISFSIQSGTLTGLIGRNGSGKTTLLKILADIIRPDTGNILIDDTNLHKHPKLKARIVYMGTDLPYLQSLTTRHARYMYEQTYPSFNSAHYEELMQRFSLQEVKRVRHFSKGQRALFGLILAFAVHPSYILLDEPMNGLDSFVKKDVFRLLIENVVHQQTAIFITSPQLHEIEQMADNFIFLEKGSISANVNPEEWKHQYKKYRLRLRGIFLKTCKKKLIFLITPEKSIPF